MSSLSQKDRVSLCSFTFSDGRRCRTPRAAKHPHFCFYHAQKEARARAAEKLGEDLAYFFSGDYLSACDLSTALARLIPAVVRGDVKPRTARTVAYLAQTLLQSIRLAQHEYINAFGIDGWRSSIRNSVNSNHDHLFPPGPAPELKQSGSLQPHPAATQPLTQNHEPVSAPPSNPPQPASQPAVIPNPVAPFANGGKGPASSPTPAAQQPRQEVPEQPRPFTAAPPASRQEPRPVAAPRTGPSGLPLLAELPPPKPKAPLGSSSQ